MFDDAGLFSQNLCPWTDKFNDKLKPEDIKAMFTGTNCPVNDELGPVTGQSELGTPFEYLCYDCTTFNQ